MVLQRKRQRRIRPEYLQALEQRILFSFGVTDTGSTFVVDTGASLVFTVAKSPPSGGGSAGDLMSMKFNGTELEAPYSATSRYSHYESGLSSSTVVTATTDPNGQWIKITCDDTGSTGTGVIQYYIAHNGDPNIYMATYSGGTAAPSPGEMRFITYTNHSVLTNAPAPSNNTGNTGAIESSDVFGHADGTTTSKYYGEYRAIDAQTYGLTGNGYGVFMNIGNRETSSGGPFFKDIDFQTTSSQSTELYTYTYSGHSQTEAFRSGLKGPYALQFTTGATPAAPDYSFIEGVGLTGYIPSSQRGTLSGTASGIPSGLQATVALSNASDQYWATPDSTGAYTISGVVAGTYTETLYQGELAVGTVQVTISGGQTTRQDITNDLNYHAIDPNSNPTTSPAVTNQIFSIGSWDGTPIGFNNADKITDMHPTDIRMNPWAADSTGVTNFTVGTDANSSFPMAEWHQQVGTGAAGSPYVDTDNRITFTLTAAQAATPLTLRIGVTREDHGRPSIKINGTSSSVPAISSQPSSRGLTTGNWRGNNTIYTFNLSTSNLIAGTNTIDIYCTSGSTGTYYSGYQIYDAVDLVPTSDLTNAPVVNSIAVSPSTATVATNQQQQFTAQAYDQSGNPIPANFSWSATSGTVDGTGLYTAPATAGSDTVTAASGSVSGSASVTVGTSNNAAPTVATPASASPNPVTGTTTNLSVLGADDGGEANLIYTWSASGPASVSYSANGTNAAKNSVATFSAAGNYTFTCTIQDSGGLSTTSSTTVTVDQTLTSIVVSPSSASVKVNATQQFSATANDQFGAALLAQPTFSWSVASGGGSIDGTGLYTAPGTAGSATIQASVGSVIGTASVTIVAPTLPLAPTNLTASKLGKNKAKLTWTDNSTDETGFHVWYSSDGVNWTLLTTVGAASGSGSTVSYTTAALGSGLWYFKVTSYNSNGDSSDSNIVSLTI